MKSENKTPSCEAFDALVKAFSDSGSVEKAHQLSGCDGNALLNGEFVKVSNLLIEMMKGGMDWIWWFTELSFMDSSSLNILPDAFVYATLVYGFIRHGNLDEEKMVFEFMGDKKPNIITYSTLINGFCQKGDFQRAQDPFSEMQHCGLIPNAVHVVSLSEAFVRKVEKKEEKAGIQHLLIRRCIKMG
ncbi:pentatricopeptide repeat-containing protein At1g52620-like [Magnolia sinica]|uniref:pentatricopeptide repeat-containing protein At1g52620-like n=1 Tax=Magnolia sinica TaxID=86752 RepID=UPI0026597E44|nr:pentatricopeptide repeat-containing protein At1g52620-like [Magnolia sinica]